jgi:hypothetical protein
MANYIKRDLKKLLISNGLQETTMTNAGDGDYTFSGPGFVIKEEIALGVPLIAIHCYTPESGKRYTCPGGDLYEKVMAILQNKGYQPAGRASWYMIIYLDKENPNKPAFPIQPKNEIGRGA